MAFKMPLGKSVSYELPPLYEQIRHILERYPDGQIFKEMIQNADDAGAKTVWFYVDERQHGTSNLPHPELAKFQGPALVAGNDACFTDEDWEGIRRLQQSIKAEDPFKVGKFGIGFNSVYHLTDLPIIASGTTLSIFDPQNIVWEGGRGHGHIREFNLNELRNSDLSHSLNGLANFSSKDTTYKHTLVRLPLRTSRSDLLRKNCYTIDQLPLDALKEEAKYLLLFLKSVNKIEVIRLTDEGQETVLKVAIESAVEVDQKRLRLARQLKILHEKNAYHISVSDGTQSVTEFNVTVTDDDIETTHFLVANRIGSNDHEVVATAESLKVFPWVGAALELSTNPGSGRVFCFLPLPDEVSSRFPVHVNGTFSVNDDRRSLKWPARGERENDEGANWNRLLVSKLLPDCYLQLLCEAKKKLTPEEFYLSWPDPYVIQHNWYFLLSPLFKKVLKEECMFSTSQSWVKPTEAVFIEEGVHLEEIICRVLTFCGERVVCVPDASSQVVWNALRLCVTPQLVTPRLVRRQLQTYKHAYIGEPANEKLKLLQYCLSDLHKDYFDLHVLDLVPLYNGEFTTFKGASTCVACYVCSEEFPPEILPNLHHLLINVQSNPSLQASLLEVAGSGHTQLELLSVEKVATLLPQCFPTWGGRGSRTVFLSPAGSVEWFKTFWEWVQKQQFGLSCFEGQLVLPLATNNTTEGFQVTQLTRVASSKVILVTRDYTSQQLSALTKLKVHCTLSKYIPYVKHEQLSFYVHNLHEPLQVLTAIANCTSSPGKIQSVSFTPSEAKHLRRLLTTQDLDFLNVAQRNVLQNLSIFERVNNKCLISFSRAIMMSHDSCPVLEPPQFAIPDSSLPSNLVVFSRSSNAQVSLIGHFGNKVVQPPNMRAFIQSIIFPMIRQRKYLDSRINSIMRDVLGLLYTLEQQDFSSGQSNISAEISRLCFVPVDTKNSRKSPSELYDPTNRLLSAMLQGENVFPFPPFNEKYLRLLKYCGLQTEVDARTLTSIVTRITVRSTSTSSPAARKVSVQKFSRMTAVMEYISLHSDVLSDGVLQQTFKDYSCLPVMKSPPKCYPSPLSWWGAHCTTHMTSYTAAAVVFGGDELASVCSLVGSQMYIVQLPSPMKKYLSSWPSAYTPNTVLAHFKHVIENSGCLLVSSVTTIVKRVYKYMQDRLPLMLDVCQTEWVWLERERKFVNPEFVFKEHSVFEHYLEPYIYLLPENLHPYQELFVHFGMKNVLTDSQIVSVLQMIKEDETDRVIPKKQWAIVKNILSWLTDNGNNSAAQKLLSSDTLYVPVESPSERPQLVEIKDVVYTDLQFLPHLPEDQFIHREVSSLAQLLGAKSLSEHLNISQNAFGDVGPREDLITRLKGILSDYKYRGGLTIVKELLQNADDAGATEMNICYDTRSHDPPSGTLIFPGTSKCRGPALLVHNNAKFSEEDFENITDLAKEAKRAKEGKIGKFGLGFCSVYHITDIPSFVSGDWYYIFDPTTQYLDDVIKDKSRPGQKIRFLERIVCDSNQLDPFVGLFEFEQQKSYNGTTFRFPFRTADSKKGLSPIMYGSTHMDELLTQVKNAGSMLLLFLQNVKRITFSQIDQGNVEPRLLLEINKENAKDVFSQSLLPDDINPWSIAVIDHEDCLNQEVPEVWISATFTKMLAADRIYKTGTASVACLLAKGSSNESTNSLIPMVQEGEVFCYLPLSRKTGLPVHVSGNFAVLKDRTGIHTSGESSEARWNSDLMQLVIPHAYYKLLTTFQGICADRNIQSDDYDFASLWPEKESLMVKKPWEDLLEPTYQLIAKGRQFYSLYCEEWFCLKNIKLLSPDILCSSQHPSTPSYVIDVVHSLNCPLVFLGGNYQKQFPQESIDAVTITEETFLQMFFSQLDQLTVSIEVRNEVLYSLLVKYAEATTDDLIPGCVSNKTYLGRYLKEEKCVPCTPEGLTLNFCSQVIDPEASFAKLYSQEDGVFPIARCNKSILHVAMRQLGMMCTNLPWDMLIERVAGIQVLYTTDKMASLEKVVIVLECIKNHNPEAALVLHTGAIISPSFPPRLIQIPFFPVAARPNKYPNCFKWYGNNSVLHTPHQLLCGDKNFTLAGSKAAIVCQRPPKCGGCGMIPHTVLRALKIKTEPSFSIVENHLSHLSSTFQTLDKDYAALKSTKQWLNEACSDICRFLELQLSQNKLKASDLHKLRESKCLWTGQEFVFPSSTAVNWFGSSHGPYLYKLPDVLRSKQNLIKALCIQESFNKTQLLNVFQHLHDLSNDEPLKEQEIKLVTSMVTELNKLLENDELEENQICYLPDLDNHMRPTDKLASYDPLWEHLKDEFCFVNGGIPPKAAYKLGVRPIGEKALESYETECHGVTFGQHEDLTQRIRDILNEYPFNESVVRELLQNADDSGASKMYIILDKRTHRTDKLPSSEWTDLQGPALLVWNDKVFSEDDIKGIQQLGLGNKRADAEKIGQYGIGFNVVYHLTDCPSFITNEQTLCVLDPHVRYVPKTRKNVPGRRYDNLDGKFWYSYSDLQSCYLRESIQGCPEEITKGTLFRFPLRHTKELLKKSKLVNSTPSIRRDKGAKILTPHLMETCLKDWAPAMKDALIFLNHVRELKFFVINANDAPTKMHLLFHYRLDLDEGAKLKSADIQHHATDFVEGSAPVSVCYPLSLYQKTHHSSKSVKWLVSRSVGDCLKRNERWGYLSEIKPKHGLATPIDQPDFSGKAFCHLPLPELSSLPVHVHGNFILDPARSGLWKSRLTGGADERAKWNNKIIEAISSSYSHFLISIQRLRLPQHPYTKKGELMKDLFAYYKAFPIWTLSKRTETGDQDSVATITKPSEFDMGTLAHLTYQKVYKQNLQVHGVVKMQPELESVGDDSVAPETQEYSVSDNAVYEPCTYLVEWHPITNTDRSKQVYFFPLDTDDSLAPILENIGMILTTAPISVREHFLDVGYNLPLADPESVFGYYCEFYTQVSPGGTFPCKIEKTKFKTVKDFKKFTAYILKTDPKSPGFPKPPFGFPLLLAADGRLHKFDKGKKAVCLKTDYSELFSNCGNRFVHPDLTGLEYDKSYFLKHSDEELKAPTLRYDVMPHWDDISDILMVTIPQSLHKPQAAVQMTDEHFSREKLTLLWKCLSTECLFTEHLSHVLHEWALILSTDDKLHCISSQVRPVIPPYLPPQRSPSFSIRPLSNEVRAHNLLKEHSLPIFDASVCNTFKCHQLCPNFSQPEQVLSIVCTLYRAKQLDSLFKKEVLDVHIHTLFSYFAGINFKKNRVSLQLLKTLPLFKDVSDNYRPILGDLYLWPSKVCKEGIDKWLPLQGDNVFLESDGEWNSLASSRELGMKIIASLSFYLQFIFPSFGVLSHEDRVVHLKHIRDTEDLFTTPYSDSKNEDLEETSDKKKQAIKYITALKQLPCLPINGVLKPMCAFCDPRASIFQKFPENLFFPPNELVALEWLTFLGKIGLRTTATKEEFIRFCDRVSAGDHSNISSSSSTLVNTLFNMEGWHEDTHFLQKVSNIPFVCVLQVPKLAWIREACAITSSYRNQEGAVHLTTLSGSVKSKSNFDNAKLIWTVKPIMWLPGLPYIGVHHDVIQKTEKFMKNIGVARKPSCQDVVQNIINIAQTRFSNFKLFYSYTSDYKPPQRDCHQLVDVLSECFRFLNEERYNCYDLRNVPCIPVCKDGSDTNDNEPVLVNPQSVLAIRPTQINQFWPTLHPLPDKLSRFFYNVLRDIGITDRINLSHIQRALTTIHNHIQFPLDPNYAKIVRLLLKSLYEKLDGSSWSSICSREPLYLPSKDMKLMKSTSLLYDNQSYYVNPHFVCSNLPYSMFSLLVETSKELTEYGFFISDLYNRLPESVRPLSLSSNSVNEIHESCKPWPAEKQSDLARQLKTVLAMSQFSECVRRLLEQKTTAKGLCVKFATALDGLLKMLTIQTVPKLIANVFLNVASPLLKLGTAQVDFLLQNNSIDDDFTLYIDSEATPLNASLLDSLTQALVQCVAKISKVDTSRFRQPEKAIESVLRARTPADLEKVLQCAGVLTSDLTFEDSSSASLFDPKIGEPIPRRWHHRLQSDINNQFRPQEIAGLEISEQEYMYVCIEHVITSGQSPESEHPSVYEALTNYQPSISKKQPVYDSDSDQESEELESPIVNKEAPVFDYPIEQAFQPASDCDSDQESEDSECVVELDKYLIHDGEETKVVTVIELFKILSIKQVNLDDGTEIVLYSPESEGVKTSEFLKDDKLKSKMKEICNDLRRIWKLKDKDQKRKSVKAMYFNWHPDKNQDPLASKAFQFLKRQVQRLEEGQALEDPDDDSEESAVAPSAPYWEEYFTMWDDIAVDHGKTWKVEKHSVTISQDNGSRLEAFDPVQTFQVQPDPELAIIWLKQAEHDLRATRILLENLTDATKEIAVHICLLGSQVAEKALKAGMYKMCGLHPGNKGHHLEGYAGALEPYCGRLRTLCSCFSGYYVTTRYPDCYNPPSVPSDQFTLRDAEEAEKNASEIYHLIEEVVYPEGDGIFEGIVKKVPSDDDV